MAPLRGAHPDRLRDIASTMTRNSSSLRERFGALDRAGIAREYNLVGESSPQHTEGSVS